MSAGGGDESGDGDDGPGRREVARRLFAAEFEDADLQYSEGEAERAPNYVVTPSGARVNRLFLVGVLTELERVNENMLRARVVDPTGAFVTYAGQYQPDELAFLERTEPPAFLAVTGKARTFQPDDSERVYSSVRPESISEVDAATRDRWVVDAARRTVDRAEAAIRAIESGRSGEALHEWLLEEGVGPALAAGLPIALDHYGTTPAYLAALRTTALDAVRMIADETDAVEGIEVAPDERGDAEVGTAGVTGRGTGTGTGGGTTGSENGVADADAAATVDDGPSGDARFEPPADREPLSSGAAEGPDNQPTAGDAGTGEDDGIGDFDPGGADGGDEVGIGVGDDESTVDAESEEGPESGADATDEGASFDPDTDVLDDDERRELESEYGTDFETAGDVAAGSDRGSGQAGGESDARDADPDAAADPERTEERSTADAADGGADDEPVDLEAAVLNVMDELDDGDGADRAAVAERVAADHGVSESAADEAIEDAMMSGRCYEPTDGRVKSI